MPQNILSMRIANMGEGNVAVKDDEFSVGMEFGVDYIMYEFEPQTFYAKCKGYGTECVLPIQASLIQNEGC
ncbi:hypothetical protein Ahy_B06g083280 [Arachis hypogaea]|uniref:Uncharacterized protein n=1 Tax=Arachis hypogaea TaxID=3818 RepID=A0A444YPJ3_ARAHY|nr:hypothetical protein Ahy_B06g083280 [Arachis hypogaea]